MQTHYALEDSQQYLREEIVDDIEKLLGGRAAEEIAYGIDKTSTGASSDLIRATSKAKSLVKYYGFSDTV